MYEGFIQQGWQCPVCGRVMAPSSMWCFWCCDKETNMVTNVTVHTDGSISGGYVRDFMVNPGKAKEDDK